MHVKAIYNSWTNCSSKFHLYKGDISKNVVLAGWDPTKTVIIQNNVQHITPKKHPQKLEETDIKPKGGGNWTGFSANTQQLKMFYYLMAQLNARKKISSEPFQYIWMLSLYYQRPLNLLFMNEIN